MRATCPGPSPCSVSGRNSPPKLMIPARQPEARKKIFSRSLKMYQNSVRLIEGRRMSNGKGVPHSERVAGLGIFDVPLKHLIHRLKYNGRWALAEFLADRLVAHEPAKALLQETQAVVPIPLHPWRQIKRGYNQAELIARK